MIPVKTRPRFKCDFCRKRSTRAAMEKHERRCFQNPNRLCDACQNTGTAFEERDYGMGVIEVEVTCVYCENLKEQLI